MGRDDKCARLEGLEKDLKGDENERFEILGGVLNGEIVFLGE